MVVHSNLSSNLNNPNSIAEGTFSMYQGRISHTGGPTGRGGVVPSPPTSFQHPQPSSPSANTFGAQQNHNTNNAGLPRLQPVSQGGSATDVATPPTSGTVVAVGGSLGLIRARDTGNSPSRARIGTLSSSYRELSVNKPVVTPNPLLSLTNPFTSALGAPRSAGGPSQRLFAGGNGARIGSSSVDSTSTNVFRSGGGLVPHDHNLLPPLYVPPLDDAPPQLMNTNTTNTTVRFPSSSAPASPAYNNQSNHIGFTNNNNQQHTSNPLSPTSTSSPTASSPTMTTTTPHHRGAVTVVFDLDETLCNNRRPGKALLRPHTMELLHHLNMLRCDHTANCYVEIVLWTASMECVARPVVERIDPTGNLFQHRIYRDRRWYKETGYTKDLKRLGREMHHTVIIENSPASVHLNRKHSILVRDFVSGPDNDLIVVKDVLDHWIRQVGQTARTLQGPPPNEPQSPSSIVKCLSEHASINSGNEVITTPPSRSGQQSYPMPGATVKLVANGGVRSSSMGLNIGSRYGNIGVGASRPSALGSRGRLF